MAGFHFELFQIPASQIHARQQLFEGICPFCAADFGKVGESAAPAFAGEFAFAAALLLFVLPFFFGADGKRLIDFGGSRRAGAVRKLAQFSFEFLDALACGLKLPL
ncbi:MAG: hypothetical protein K2X38_00320, partial [Gemmataceae bacterium]|nr:hypothetical protein [Gemmataceae bacterium]